MPWLLARGQGLHMQGIIGVLGGSAETLVKAIVPLASPPLAFCADLTVGFCHLVFLQCIVYAFLGVPPPLLFASHLWIPSPLLLQDVIFLSSP